MALVSVCRLLDRSWTSFSHNERLEMSVLAPEANEDGGGRVLLDDLATEETPS